MRSCRRQGSGLLHATALLGALGVALALATSGKSADDAPDVAALIRDLSGPDAVAEQAAADALVAAGDRAVPALAALIGNDKADLPPRLIAVEVLGRIGSPPARQSMVAALRDEKHLAVRGQLCMQIGEVREAAAVPVLLDWLKTIGPGKINDTGGPKEVLPATCYIRHIEALAMIGDARAIPALEEFREKVPKGVGYGGFLTNFVTGAANEALGILREKVAFASAIARHPGLDAKIAPLMDFLHADQLARYRMWADQVRRGTDGGREVLAYLAKHDDKQVAAGAAALLAVYDDLRRQMGGSS